MDVGQIDLCSPDHRFREPQVASTPLRRHIALHCPAHQSECVLGSPHGRDRSISAHATSRAIMGPSFPTDCIEHRSASPPSPVVQSGVAASAGHRAKNNLHPRKGRMTSATRRFWLAASLLTLILMAELVLQGTAAISQADQANSQTGQFTGQVLSASGALVVGGAPADPGHPVEGSTIHLVPVTAIDTTSQMTASAILCPTVPGGSLR